MQRSVCSPSSPKLPVLEIESWFFASMRVTPTISELAFHPFRLSTISSHVFDSPLFVHRSFPPVPRSQIVRERLEQNEQDRWRGLTWGLTVSFDQFLTSASITQPAAETPPNKTTTHHFSFNKLSKDPQKKRDELWISKHLTKPMIRGLL